MLSGGGGPTSGRGERGLGGGGRGQISPAAIYCTITWCFALRDFAQWGHKFARSPHRPSCAQVGAACWQERSTCFRRLWVKCDTWTLPFRASVPHVRIHLRGKIFNSQTWTVSSQDEENKKYKIHVLKITRRLWCEQQPARDPKSRKPGFAKLVCICSFEAWGRQIRSWFMLSSVTLRWTFVCLGGGHFLSDPSFRCVSDRQRGRSVALDELGWRKSFDRKESWNCLSTWNFMEITSSTFSSACWRSSSKSTNFSVSLCTVVAALTLWRHKAWVASVRNNTIKPWNMGLLFLHLLHLAPAGIFQVICAHFFNKSLIHDLVLTFWDSVKIVLFVAGLSNLCAFLSKSLDRLIWGPLHRKILLSQILHHQSESE